METYTEEKWLDEATIFLRRLQKLFSDEFSSFNKSIKNDIGKDAVVILGFQCLRMLDGIAILIEQGRCDAALILVRSLFEVMLQLCYLINDEGSFEEKAGFYFVVADLKRYDYNRKAVENMRKLDLAIGAERIKYGEGENNKIIQKLENASGILKEVYIFIRDKRGIDYSWNNIEWYKTFNSKYGIKNFSNRDLCQEIQFYDIIPHNDVKILMYDILYNALSQQTHGSASIENIVIVDGVQRFRNYDCIQYGWVQISFIYKMFLKLHNDLQNMFKNQFCIDSCALDWMNENSKALRRAFGFLIK